MPSAKSICRLEGIVVGCSDAVFLQDIAGIGKLRIKWTAPVCSRGVYVGHDVQLATLAAYVTNSDDRGVAEALFHLQAIVKKIRCEEILVDRVCGECVATAVRI